MESNGVELQNRWCIAVGLVLRDTRISAGLKQEELAHRSQLSRASLQQVEHGRTAIRLLTLVKICAELNIEPDVVVAQAGALVKSSDEFALALARINREAVPGRPRLSPASN